MIGIGSGAKKGDRDIPSSVYLQQLPVSKQLLVKFVINYKQQQKKYYFDFDMCVDTT